MAGRSRLLRALNQATNKKRGQVSLSLKPVIKERLLLCRRCSHMIKVDEGEFRGHRGSKIPEEHGCPVCDHATCRASRDGRWSYGPGYYVEHAGISWGRANRAIIHNLNLERKAHGLVICG